MCEYVYEDLKCKVEADEENKPDIACRYIQKEYGYAEADAKEMIQKIMEDKEVFEEYFRKQIMKYIIRAKKYEV